LTAGKVTPEDEAAFNEKTQGAQWLFSDSLLAYLTHLYKKGIKVNVAPTMNSSSADSDALKLIEEDHTALREWVSLQYTVIDEKFAPFLRQDVKIFDMLRRWWFGLRSTVMRHRTTSGMDCTLRLRHKNQGQL